MTGIHSHLLYGVDDGMQTESETFTALDYLERQGVQGIYLTPHVMENFPENNPKSLKQHFYNLIKGYAGNIDLRLAAEYMLDGSFNSHLENSKNKPLAIADEHLLVETSYLSPPLNFHQTIKKIKKKGYSIILAHPERYLYMDRTTTKTESRRLSVFSAESSFSDRILRQTGSEKCGISSQYSLESHRQAFKIKSLTAKLTDRINVLIENNRQLFQLKFS